MKNENISGSKSAHKNPRFSSDKSIKLYYLFAKLIKKKKIYFYSITVTLSFWNWYVNVKTIETEVIKNEINNL